MALLVNRIVGKNVVVNSFPTLAKLRLIRKATANPVAASNTGGGMDRGEGNIMITGYMWAWGHTPPVFPGQTFAVSFTITGATAPPNGEVGSITSVMCTGMEINVLPYDPHQQNRIYYVVHFGPAGYDLTYSTTTPPIDTAVPAFFSTKSLGISLNGSAEDGVEQMKLQVHNLAHPAIDSSYNGIWYVPSGNIDWSLQYERAITSLSPLPTINSVCAIQMSVTPAAGSNLYWQLHYGRVTEPLDGTFDRESERSLANTVRLEKCISGTDIGSIVTPAGSTVWP